MLRSCHHPIYARRRIVGRTGLLPTGSRIRLPFKNCLASPRERWLISFTLYYFHLSKEWRKKIDVWSAGEISAWWSWYGEVVQGLGVGWKQTTADLIYTYPDRKGSSPFHEEGKWCGGWERGESRLQPIWYTYPEWKGCSPSYAQSRFPSN